MAPIIKDKRFLIGSLLVIVGVVLIIDNFGFFPHILPRWIWTWQSLLIVIGIFSMLTSERIGPGIILIAVGSLFLFPDILRSIFPDFRIDGNMIWYLLIIIIGLALILNRGQEHRGYRRHRFNNMGTDSTDLIDELTFFGGGEKIINSNNFQGGRITTIFGGSEINLTQANLAEGIQEIEVFAMFGGWELIVPPNWQVKTEVTSIFGAVSDKRMVGPDTVRDHTRTLLIKGFVMFGGGEIKTYKA